MGVLNNLSRRPLGLYVHWPFCLSKCPYCDFNSHVRESYSENDWLSALKIELDYMAAQTSGHVLKSIFFGGGTPSLMSPETVEKVINHALTLWSSDASIEISMEANPNSVEREKFQSFAAAGVNRISVGVQALNDKDLKQLGRTHGVDEALRAIDVAATTFDRYSFDLIYARPDQTVEAWEKELEYALTLAGSHLSLYQLTIEPGTAFEKLYDRGDLKIPNDIASEKLYLRTQEIMDVYGMPAYEVSNHARPDHECQHNLIYWRYDDYVGVGPGAHGRITTGGQKRATQCYKAPEMWLEKVKECAHGIHRQEIIDAQGQLLERVMMGLRLREGVLWSKTRDDGAMLNAEHLTHLLQEGLLIDDGDYLKASPEGLLKLNAVLHYLFR